MQWRVCIDNYSDLIDWLLKVASSRKPDQSEVMVVLQYCRENKGIPMFRAPRRHLARIHKTLDEVLWDEKRSEIFSECLHDLYKVPDELGTPVAHLLAVAGLTDVATMRCGPGLWGASGLRWVREDETDLLPDTLEYLVVESTASARRCGIDIDVCCNELSLF